MSTRYTKKEIKLAKRAMRRESRFTYGERKKSESSLARLVGKTKGGATSKRIIKGSGLSRSDRGGLLDILGSSKKTPSPSEQSAQSISSERTPSKPSEPSKPRTSWWKAVTSPYSGGSQPQSDKFQRRGASSTRNYDKLRQQFGGTREGVGYTDKSESSSSKPPRRSLFGTRKLH